jgi:hypothetical protein
MKLFWQAQLKEKAALLPSSGACTQEPIAAV